MLRRTLFLALTLLAIAVAFVASVSRAQCAPALTGHPCNIPNAGQALCMKFAVPENRAVPGGRQLHLTVVYFKSYDAHPLDAITPLAGGPGEGSVATMDDYFTRAEYETLRRHHAVLFVDSRGTGTSDRIECAGDWNDPETYFRSDVPLLDDKSTRACRDELVQRADLNLYGNANVAADLDALRKQLGLSKLTLLGFSGGTLTAQVYARRYPQSVRAIVIGGVASPHHPALSAAGRQLALDEVFRRCKADARCHAAFPHIESEFATLLQRVKFKPVRADATIGGKSVPVTLAYAQFGDRLGFMLYAPETGAKIPLLLHEAYLGNWTPFFNLSYMLAHGFYRPGNGTNAALDQSAISRGVYYSTVCSEGVPFITAHDDAVDANSFIGDTRNSEYRHLCSLWNVRPVAPDASPIAAPTLVISNKYDPACPWFIAHAMLSQLRNGRQVTDLAWGHLQDWDCIKAMLLTFVEHPDPNAVDASCASEPQRVQFATSP